MGFTRSELLQACKQAAEIVKSWPRWKQIVCEEALINSPWRRGSPERTPPNDPAIKRFYDLPLGTRFKYLQEQIDSNQVFVVLENWGVGLIAKWNGVEYGPINQVLAFADSEEDAKAWSVRVVDGADSPPAPELRPTIRQNHPVILGETKQGRRVVETYWEWSPERGNVAMYKLHGINEPFEA
jgi:hypothetical protein